MIIIILHFFDHKFLQYKCNKCNKYTCLNDQLGKLTSNTRMILQTNKETICRWGIPFPNPNAPRNSVPCCFHYVTHRKKNLPRDIAQNRIRFLWDTGGNKNVYFTAVPADLSSRVLCREFVLGGLNIRARVPRKRHAGIVEIYLNALQSWFTTEFH